MRARLRTWLLDAFLIAALTAVLIWPLFRTKYLNNWGSIDSTFIADGRFLAENWPHPRWQPLWYCGTRFDYIYPPALRYGTAGLTKLFPIVPARAYHLYTAFFYCVGIAAVYLLIRIGSRSRGAAWLGAAATALLSPSFLFLTDLRIGARVYYLAPQRLYALIRWGEGPHISALALVPLALAAAFLGLRKGHTAALGMSALFCALVASTNFYGATALALLFPPLVWALWVTTRDHRTWARAAGLIALAYGLTAFWLVPSYIRVTMRNLKLVAQPGNAWSVGLLAALALVFAAVTLKLARGRRERAYPLFVVGAMLLMSLFVLGEHFFGFRIAGEPTRLVPELDLAFILAAVELARWMWHRIPRPPGWRTGVALIVAGCLLQAWPYFRHSRSLYERDFNYQQRIEYRITQWINDNLPGARALATGSVRFWYDVWHDLPQIGGGSDQGTLNMSTYDGQWELTGGDKPETSVLWLQALGAEAIIVHDKTSQEIYHDYTYPGKFAGFLPAVYDDGQGNRIYRAPRRFADRARVVLTRQLEQPSAPDKLRAYADAIERGPDSRAQLLWEAPDAFRVRATFRPGESLIVQESYDPAWRAYAAGRRLPVRADPMGFLWIEPPPGEQEIRVVFELPLESLVGRVVTLVAVAAVLLLAGVGWRRSRRT